MDRQQLHQQIMSAFRQAAVVIESISTKFRSWILFVLGMHSLFFLLLPREGCMHCSVLVRCGQTGSCLALGLETLVGYGGWATFDSGVTLDRCVSHRLVARILSCIMSVVSCEISLVFASSSTSLSVTIGASQSALHATHHLRCAAGVFSLEPDETLSNKQRAASRVYMCGLQACLAPHSAAAPTSQAPDHKHTLQCQNTHPCKLR